MIDRLHCPRANSILLTSTVLFVACLWGHPAAAEAVRPPAVQRALGRIMTEDRVMNAAYSVCEKGAGRTESERFDLLAAYVLPSEAHDTLRMSYDMTPACPSPLVPQVVPGTPADHLVGTIQFSGSDFVSPAQELVRVAAQLGRLAEVRQRVKQWQPAGPEDEKAAAALLVAIACQERDFSEAERALQQLLALARQHVADRSDRPAETLAMWSIVSLPELQEQAQDLSFILNEDVTRDKPRRSERWKRMVFALRQSLNHPAPTPPPSDSPLPAWIPVSRMHSETRGAGYPRPTWILEPGKAFHRTGHDHDYLYYRSPLRGTYSVDLDASAFGYRDVHLAQGGYWAGPAWGLESGVRGLFRQEMSQFPLSSRLTRILESLRLRLDVTPDAKVLYANGKEIQRLPTGPQNDPWLGVHCWWLAHGTVSDLRITGEPEIPETISLMTPNLDGWMSYYDELIGGTNSNWFVRLSSSSSALLGLGQAAEEWELFSGRNHGREGTFNESLIRYHRPMIEDGTVEYEFYYEPGASHVHPVLDRMCFVLNPGGVDIHWATDGRHDPSSVSPGNLVSEPPHRRTNGSLPLKAQQWNKLALTIRGQTVALTLNGELIDSRSLEASNQRTFGLFHWSDQTDARVRNLRWTGDWPRELPEVSNQALADLRLERELGDRESLSPVIRHRFQDPLPPQWFSILGINADPQTEQRADGLLVTSSGTGYVHTFVHSPIAVTGDFDIIAEFADFQSQVAPHGEGSIRLAAFLDDERSSECYLIRKYAISNELRDEQVLQAARFEKRGQEIQYNFFAAPAEEATAGRLRLARRGTTLYSLFAEAGSDRFRLAHRETVSGEPAWFRIGIEHQKTGKTSALLKSLDVRAAGHSGLITEPLMTATQLDQSRQQLAAEREWNFPKKGDAVLQQFSIFGPGIGSYTTDAQGLLVDVPGSDNWSASGLMSRCQIEGDFDIALDLEVVHLEACKLYDESCIHLVAEFRDARQSTIETKFSIHNQGDRKAETQLRLLRRQGHQEFRELVSQSAPDVVLLRLARRGDVVYQVFQSSTDKSPFILGAVKLGREPVLPGDLRVLIHTGGVNRKTIMRLRNLKVWADQIADP